jgi:ribosomal protein S27AE
MSDYAQNWKSFDRLRYAWLAVIFIFAPIVAIPLTMSLLDSLFFALWAAALTYVSVKLKQWPCPRCGQALASEGPYSESGLRSWMRFYPKRCGNCGLAIHAAESEATSS